QVGPNGALVFSPSAVTVNAGDTVDWQWMTGYHSTTGQQSPETWDSGVQYAPHTFSHTFMKPGTYSYFCSVHAALGMTGTVSVRAAVTTTTRPPSTSTTRPTTTIAPVSTSCTSIKACETALTTALPLPGTAKTGKERRIAGLLQKLARRADHQLERAMAASGARQAHLSKKANRTLERLRAAAGKAESQGTLAVPLGPIDADVGSLESLDQSP